LNVVYIRITEAMVDLLASSWFAGGVMRSRRSTALSR